MMLGRYLRRKAGRPLRLRSFASFFLLFAAALLALSLSIFLFLSAKNESIVGESTIRRFLNIHAKMAKLQLIPIHSLRHSNTTWLLSNKDLTIAEIGKISERLGHNSKKITLDIYYHINDISEGNILKSLI